MKLSPATLQAIKIITTNNESVEVQKTKEVNGYVLYYAKASVLTPTIRVSEVNGSIKIETLVSPEYDKDGNFTEEFKRIEKFHSQYFTEDEFVIAVRFFN